MNNPVKPEIQTPLSTPTVRGRPRNPQVREAILRAAQEIIEESGPASVTMEGVAARAGVGKPTVYRLWPDRHAVAMDALMQSHAHPSPARRTRTAIKALQQQLETVAEVFASRTGRSVANMIAAADNDSELAKSFRNHFVMARREEGRALLKEAMEAGELRGDINIDVALDLIYGALFFRLLMSHAELDRKAAQQILTHALRGLQATHPQ